MNLNKSFEKLQRSEFYNCLSKLIVLCERKYRCPNDNSGIFNLFYLSIRIIYREKCEFINLPAVYFLLIFHFLYVKIFL